jgi:HEAT repeat protein
VKLAFTIAFAVCASAQTTQLTALLHRFDEEHDLARKERLLGKVTSQYPSAGAALLRLARTSANVDTRWMAMRGMATLRFKSSTPFLEESLRDSDASIRANAARALSDLRSRTSAEPLLAMFVVERDDSALQQGSLALKTLGIKAAAPILRQKISETTGQTRAWLIQALGRLGDPSDVPLIASNLDVLGGSAATEALQELTGVDFGIVHEGLTGYPPPSTLAARAWWQAHSDTWPRCDDCRKK